MNIVQQIKKEIAELQEKLCTIQDQCSHPEPCLTKEHGSTTGNFDGVDHYWTVFRCSLCEGSWTEEGSL